ncbi:MAG: PAS domain S-box protein [Proteobacteria bacterium]|nr:PAS domain S-box protein [Pseudomonadota bacterium]
MDDVRERSVDDDTFPVVEDHIVPAAGDDTPSAWRRLVIYLSIPAALGIAYFLIHTAILHGGIQPHTVMEVLGIFLVLVVGIFAAVIIGKPASPVGKFPAMDDVVPAMEDATDSAVVDGPYLARRRSLVYWGLAAVLVMSYVVLRTSTWQGGAQLHTIMEVVATLLALMVTAMALVRFYSKKNNTFLFIGTGFLGTAFLDGYHAVVTSKFFAPYLPSDLPALIPWSWVASRQFLSVLLCLSWLAWVREQRLGKPGRISERTVYLTSGILTLASFLFFAFVPLPRAYYPEFIFHRPEEFLPAFFFLVALIGYLRKGEWRSDVFEHWLVLSLIVGFLGQTVFMSFSGQLFDMEFDAAHLLKKVSYVCVLTGLLVSMYSSFRRAEESTMILAKAYGMLRTEVTEREHAEEALRGSEERFRTLIDSSSQGILVHRHFRPLYANRTLVEMFGYDNVEEILALGSSDPLFVPDDRSRRYGYHEARLRGEIVPTDHEFKGLRKDGSEIWLSNRAFRIEWKDGPAICTTLFDISERKQAEEEMRRQSDGLDLLYRVTAIANEADTSEYAMATSIQYICVTMDWPVGHAYVRGSDSLQSLASTDLWYLADPDRFAAFRKATANIDCTWGVGLPGRVLASGEPEWITDVTKDLDFQRATPADDAGLRTGIAMPVLVGQEVVAVLEFFCTRAVQPDQSLLQVLVNIGAQLGRVFERKRAETELTAKERALWERVTELRDTQEALEEKSRELATHRDHLEEKVAERTAEVQRQAEQLAQALQKEQELNTLQRDFVSLVSHEFRTPLTIIDGAAQRLVRRKGRVTPEDLVARTDKIRAAVQRMTGLIDSTLDAARLDAGTFSMERQPCDLKGLIREVCARQAEISRFHDIRVDVAGLPEDIHADPKLLDQVFTNLLSNAVKYAPDDPHIEVKGWTDGDFAAVSVRDRGVGVPADDLPRLCERFFRARTSTGITGTGIGLNLVKKLVEMHKGTIEVDSVEGQGSVFTVRLPIDLRAAGAPAQGTGDRATPVLTAVKGRLAT